MHSIHRAILGACLTFAIVVISGCALPGSHAASPARSAMTSRAGSDPAAAGAASRVPSSPAGAPASPTKSLPSPPAVKAHSARPVPRSQSPSPAREFLIRPLLASGTTGTITEAGSSMGVDLQVTITGLLPGSAHTVDDPAGTCGSDNMSIHLALLATAVANSRGVIAFDATVPAFEFGAGRIVIVYATAQPVLITGCAAL